MSMEIITENLDLWTSALLAKSSAGRGSGGKIESYGIKKLRELILELAVRGKLVPQDPSEEPASLLLEKIAKEKARLIKDGAIKKEKLLPEISDDEKPFVLPNGWEWSRLQNVSSYVQRGKGPHYADHGKVQVVSQKCIQWAGFDPSQARYVDDASLDGYQPERFVRKDDLLWNSTGTGTAGRINVIPEVEPNSLVADSHVTIVRPLLVSSRFLCCYVSAPGIQQRIEPEHENSLVSGTTNQVELNLSAVVQLAVPVPPVAEQHRIVAKVDELMALCDKLEEEQADSIEAHEILVETLLGTLTAAASSEEFAEAWTRISEHFETLFTTEQSIEALKKTILQLAVMGKLVPQDPNDEPASILLKLIEADKAKLIGDGKIKKDKPLAEISEDEKPYDLPQSWEWVRIGQIALSTDYGLSEKTFNDKSGIPVLKMGDIVNGQVTLDGQKTVSAQTEGLPELFLEDGDLLYNRTNSAELVGKTGIFTGGSGNYTFASYLIRIRLSKGLVAPEFLNICMNSNVFRETQIEPHLKQQCGQANVNGTIMRNMRVPLPPLAEQHRIVAKVGELTAICDSLKEHIIEARETQIHLADAIVEQAVA